MDAELIRFPCPGCGRGLRAPNERSGRKVRCPKCLEVALVPGERRSRPGSGPRPTAGADALRGLSDDYLAGVSDDVLPTGQGALPPPPPPRARGEGSKERTVPGASAPRPTTTAERRAATAPPSGAVPGPAGAGVPATAGEGAQAAAASAGTPAASAASAAAPEREPAATDRVPAPAPPTPPPIGRAPPGVSGVRRFLVRSGLGVALILLVCGAAIAVKGRGAADLLRVSYAALLIGAGIGLAGLAETLGAPAREGATAPRGPGRDIGAAAVAGLAMAAGGFAAVLVLPRSTSKPSVSVELLGLAASLFFFGIPGGFLALARRRGMKPGAQPLYPTAAALAIGAVGTVFAWSLGGRARNMVAAVAGVAIAIAHALWGLHLLADAIERASLRSDGEPRTGVEATAERGPP